MEGSDGGRVWCGVMGGCRSWMGDGHLYIHGWGVVICGWVVVVCDGGLSFVGWG